ncbi:MAG: glycosyltransferase family 1 protein [bacterium]
MTIGIDIRTLMDAHYSGVSEYTLNLLKNILALDKTNKYVLFLNSAKDIKLPEFKQSNVWLVYRRFPNKFLNYGLFKFLNYPKVDKLMRQSVDIWWMPHFNFISLPAGKNILTFHDLSFLRYPEFFSTRKNFWHKMVNVKKLTKKFDHIVAISENTKRDLIELCDLPEDKITVIFSAISNKYKKVEEQNKLARVKQKYGLPKKFILYLGTIEPRKNIESLILAYNDLRDNNQFLYDHELIIAGADGWKSKQVYDIADKSPYYSNIKFLGYVDDEDKACLYSLASLFVFPSFYEGFGFPPLEAAACGTPVVSSFASSIPEIMADSALLVDPYNYRQISLAMEQVLTNEELKQKLIAKGLQRAKEFNWQKTALGYLKLFEQ